MSNTATTSPQAERQVALCNEARKANGLAPLTKSQAIRHLKSFGTATKVFR